MVALRSYDISLPANIDQFGLLLKEVIQFEFLNADSLIELFLPEFDLPSHLGFTKDQMESSLLFSCGSFISMALILILVIIVLTVVKKILPKYKEKIKGIFAETIKEQFWSGILKS